MHRFAPWVIWLAVLGLVASCTPLDKVHRALGPDQAICGDVLDLARRNVESNQDQDNPARCYLQSHVVPAVDLAPETSNGDWPTLATSAGRDLKQGQSYHLGFVEIGDTGTLLAPRQLHDLRAHLSRNRQAGQQNYVIAFVHGWRHDASLRDLDVKKFRTLLGYARAALNTRCVMRGAYCNAALTGVFVAWRGRSFAEPVLVADGTFNPMAVIAAPTLFDRKVKSDVLGAGPALAGVLDQVQDRLRLDPGRTSADKMLVVGHSLGGNMLASLMEDRASAAIRAHPLPAPGGAAPALRPPLGDLVVLINPAAEAAKWTRLQQEMRQKVGLGIPDNQLSASIEDQIDPDLWQKLRPWREMFPLDQRPVYLSITAAANWSGFETNGRSVAYDGATGVLFPIARWFQGLRAPEDRKAIGHHAPHYRTQKTLISPAAGTTHEFSVNQGTGERARYDLSAQPATSWCDPAEGWLRAVRDDQIAQGWSFGDAWDYGLSPRESDGRLGAAENIARGINPASVQWRHSLNLSGQPGLWSVVPGRSPFWNVRALDTAIREHAGYVNYPMWCAINQLVLDDITSPRRPDPTVDAVRTAERVLDVQNAIAAAAEADPPAD